jgi:molecular chaperone GrpE
VTTIKIKKETNPNKNEDNSTKTKKSANTNKDAPEGEAEESKVALEDEGRETGESDQPNQTEQTVETAENAGQVIELQEDPIAAERDKLKDQLLRLAADFDNFRKRTRREIEDVKVRAREDVLRELLPIFDNLRRAISASSEAQNAESIIEGVQMVLKLFEDTGERLGLKQIDSLGQRFDPAIHDAIQQVESTEHQPGTIVSEITPGYLFGTHLLRAAMVVVARPPKKIEPIDDSNSAEGNSSGEVSQQESSQSFSKNEPPSEDSSDHSSNGEGNQD